MNFLTEENYENVFGPFTYISFMYICLDRSPCILVKCQ